MERLTDQQLQQAEVIIHNMGGCGVTLANELIADLRHYKQLAEDRGKTITEIATYVADLSLPNFNDAYIEVKQISYRAR